MAKAIARRRSGYTHDVEIDGEHTVVFDEPEAAGGTDEGPSPTRMVAAALAACTAITVEMYAGRKGWELGDVEVEVDLVFGEKGIGDDFTVTLHLGAELSDEQLERILVIAGKCPVHRVLERETHVSITDRIAPVSG